ncbi:MAG TPA: ribosome biogenesis GTPase Der [Spirochaetales bacterium]|nr:ribosome biogenesis GTPase Der [Spirochaetales bacterium]HRY54210.1 ribosome biogenesis GTPase Der [Spirochaetia bacterium]HRZ64287.1 ribosome biogenesis GTPase Der [Spirochaetia bacterium]
MKREPSPPDGAEPAAGERLPEDARPAEPRGLRYLNLPLVVIAGRPNVGKSTLYNRLLHKRRAITDPTPGVTRDPVDAVCDIGRSGKRCLLVDTGGFKLDREGLDGLVVEKSLQYLERADLIVFLLDAAQRSPEDQAFSELLRKWSPKVLLVVNKADSPERDQLAWANAERGYGHAIFVSAEHGRNVDELEQALLDRLDFSKVVEVEEGREPIRLAIMGKPNTGKSTLLNRLLGSERSIVSEVAGTTRDVVEGRFEWKGRQVVVLDTAGIRRKKKVTEAVEYYSVNRAIRVVDESDVVVLMIDAREGLTEQDKKITAFASEKGRAVVFALNKWDEMPDLKNSFEAARDKLRYFFGQMAWAPVLPLSAKEGTGLDKLMNTVVNLHAQLNKRIETSRLNKAFADWVESTPPPVGTRTRFKVRYAVQTSVNPQKFTVFVTRPDAVADSYLSFLRNKIRGDLGLDKIPVILELKASRSPIVSRPVSRAEKVKEAALAKSGRPAEAKPRRPLFKEAEPAKPRGGRRAAAEPRGPARGKAAPDGKPAKGRPAAGKPAKGKPAKGKPAAKRAAAKPQAARRAGGAKRAPGGPARRGR